MAAKHDLMKQILNNCIPHARAWVWQPRVTYRPARLPAPRFLAPAAVLGPQVDTTQSGRPGPGTVSARTSHLGPPG